MFSGLLSVSTSAEPPRYPDAVAASCVGAFGFDCPVRRGHKCDIRHVLDCLVAHIPLSAEFDLIEGGQVAAPTRHTGRNRKQEFPGKSPARPLQDLLTHSSLTAGSYG